MTLYIDSCSYRVLDKGTCNNALAVRDSVTGHFVRWFYFDTGAEREEAKRRAHNFLDETTSANGGGCLCWDCQHKQYE